MKLVKLFASIAIAFSAGAIGSIATTSNIPTWYAGLDKPPLLPPNSVFGPVWSVLYLAMGVSLFLVWTAKNEDSKQKAYIAFAVQLVLNTLWSLVFFGLHQTWLAVAIILLLIVSIIMTMRYFAPFSKVAAWLLVPYVAWVCFATYLNTGVALLN